MFSDMIRSSLRDEDFISGKFFKFYYIMLPFSFIVCHVQRIMIMFFCLFVVGCALDLGLISSDDLSRVASGDIQEGSDEEDKLAVKICLEFVTMCCSLSTICTDATNSAIRYLFTIAKDNDFHGNLHFKRKSCFSSDGPTLSDESGGKLCKVSSKVVNKGCEKVDKTIDIDAYVPDEFHLDEFLISDQGVLTFDGDLLFT